LLRKCFAPFSMNQKSAGFDGKPRSIKMLDSEKKKMLAGELYHAGDREIQADQATAKAWMVRYNAALGASADERRSILQELLGEVGSGVVVRPPFHCDFGYNIRIGDGVFLKLQLRHSRCGSGNYRCRDTNWSGSSNLHCRPSTRSCHATNWSGVRTASLYWRKRLDWRRRNHPSGRDDR